MSFVNTAMALIEYKLKMNILSFQNAELLSNPFLTFSSTYLYDAGFSAVRVILKNYRDHLEMYSALIHTDISLAQVR